jgi:hypothetical protein
MFHNTVYKMFIVCDTVIILYALHTWYVFMFMTYSTTYCHFDKLWMFGMYICKLWVQGES